MNLEEYRTVFLVASLALIMIVAFPTLSMIMPFPSSQERFSELWILGPNHVVEDYPFNVQANETYRIFVGVGNHLDYSAYYVVYVKFRNQTQPPPNSTVSSPLPPLYEFQFFLADGEAWEAPLNFTIRNISLQKDSIFVGNISINGVTFPVSCPSTWDSKNKGFYYQLFFELWIYDLENSSFQFHNRFAGIWLNMTV
jgi:uncharacterized membrane protein